MVLAGQIIIIFLTPCSLSAGISFFTQGETYKSLYKKADIALYKVKENGRCGCKIFEQ